MNKSLELNFLAHPVRQYRLLMFTNTESLSKTKHNIQDGPKKSSKLLFKSSPNTDGLYTLGYMFHKVV